MDPAAHFMKVPSFGPLEFAPCALCGTSAGTLVTRQHVFGEHFEVVKCNECGLIRTNPRPTAEWKQHFYDPAYNGWAEAHGRDFVYAPDPTRLGGYRRLLKLLQARVAPGSTLLDVGCASGLFVNEARLHGFDAMGCDYSERAIAYGKEHFGVNIIRSVAESIETPDDQYDVVTILHVIEHLPDPLAALREMHRVLKPGGLLLLETVNYRAHYVIEKRFKFLVPIYGALTKRGALPWVPFDHLYHWSPDAMTRAMHVAGFRTVELHHLSGYRSEQKPDARFSVAYALSEAANRALLAVSGGRWDFWPPLITTGIK